MPLTVADLRDQLPDFDTISTCAELTVNGETYTIAETETRSPAPGEQVRYLYLESGRDQKTLSWGSGHTRETVWIYDSGADPMTDGTEVQCINYGGK